MKMDIYFTYTNTITNLTNVPSKYNLLKFCNKKFSVTESFPHTYVRFFVLLTYSKPLDSVYSAWLCHIVYKYQKRAKLNDI